MKKWLIGSMICALSGVVFLAACKKKNSDDDNTPSNNFDRKAMLTNYADNYIVPAYTVTCGSVLICWNLVRLRMCRYACT